MKSILKEKTMQTVNGFELIQHLFAAAKECEESGDLETASLLRNAVNDIDSGELYQKITVVKYK